MFIYSESNQPCPDDIGESITAVTVTGFKFVLVHTEIKGK